MHVLTWRTQSETLSGAPAAPTEHQSICATQDCVTQGYRFGLGFASSGCDDATRSTDGTCPNSDGTYGPGHWERPNPSLAAWWSPGGKRVLPGVWLHVNDYGRANNPSLKSRGPKHSTKTSEGNLLAQHSSVADRQSARVTDMPGAHELVLSGLSRWAPHQLDGELSRGDWWLCYPEPWDVVSLPPEHMWDTLARHALQVCRLHLVLSLVGILLLDLLVRSLI
jgi:hypothetical protein